MLTRTIIKELLIFKEMLDKFLNIFNNHKWCIFLRWLPDGDEMQKTLDSMVGNAYLYGREWLANKVGETTPPCQIPCKYACAFVTLK